jgi:hypothetical protein
MPNSSVGAAAMPVSPLIQEGGGMNQHTNHSEVAQLRNRIDQEIDAMRQAISGYAIVARHEMITNHYQNLGACFEELTARIGEEAAIKEVIARLEGRL